MDSALDDFLKRFPATEGEPLKRPRPQVQAVSSLKPGGIVAGPKPNIGAEGLASTDDLKASVSSDSGAASGGKAAGAMGAVMDAAPAAMGLLSNAQGGQFDTSAEGGGVGKAGGAIMQGAAQGAQLGQVAGPWGMAIGAAVGGGISAVAHNDAKKKYYDNRKKYNLKNDAIEDAEAKETYAISEGLVSMDGLKALREKQLGLIS